MKATVKLNTYKITWTEKGKRKDTISICKSPLTALVNWCKDNNEINFCSIVKIPTLKSK